MGEGDGRGVHCSFENIVGFLDFFFSLSFVFVLGSYYPYGRCLQMAAHGSDPAHQGVWNGDADFFSNA